MEKKERIAVILLNLGGPDCLKSVKPFLFNLFSDKNIIPLPAIIRYPLAWLISRLRHKKAQKIYSQIGGKSPIFEETIKQKRALEQVFTQFYPQADFKLFIAMRYWYPRMENVLDELQKEAVDKVILLPLYPQFSTTTTKSSFEEWDILAKNKNIAFETKKICCYPENDGFILGYAGLIEKELKKSSEIFEIIFSAHGIPQDCIDKGDPYEEHVQKSVDKIVDYLRKKYSNFNSHISYQSKVGPKKWLLPNTEEVITKLSEQKKNLMIVPIAFVSEHSETLVELDIDYRNIALEKGASSYIRIKAVAIEEIFIKELAKLVMQVSDGEKIHKICSEKFCECYQS